MFLFARSKSHSQAKSNQNLSMKKEFRKEIFWNTEVVSAWSTLQGVQGTQCFFHYFTVLSQLWRSVISESQNYAFHLASVTPLRLIISSELQISTDPAKHLSTCSTLRTYCVLGGFPQCELSTHFAGWTALYHNYITSGREPYSFPKGSLLFNVSV